MATRLHLLVAASMLSTTLAFAQNNTCGSIASALKEFSISTQSSAYLNSTFDNYCEQSGEATTRSVGFGLDAVVKAIPLKFTGNYGSTSEGLKNFCKSYANVINSTERRFTSEERISSKAIEAVSDCVRIAALGAFVDHKIRDRKTVDFFLASGAATKLEIKGLFPNPSKGVKCLGVIGSAAVTFGPSTFSKVESTQSVSCSRIPNKLADGKLVFEEQVVTIHTNLGNYSVYFPQDERTPLNMARDISSRLDRMEQSVETRVGALERRSEYGGSFQSIDPGQPADNQVVNPLTGGVSCPAGFRQIQTGRIRTAEPQTSNGVGANQFACVRP